jgi:O-antigen ligase
MADWIKSFGPKNFYRARFERLADGLAVALVISLPWSTSATGILAVLWLIAVVPTLDRPSLRRVVTMPAGGLPLLFWLLAFVGTLWAFGVPMPERWDGLKSLHKFLVMPLLIVQFQRSDRAAWMMKGFLASCGALLILSWLMVLFPGLPLPWHWRGSPGVPVKDYIAQSAEFTVCMFVLVGFALKVWREGQRGLALACVLLALVFLGNMLFVTTSRTSLVVIPVLALLLVFKQASLKHTMALLLAVAVLGVAGWSFTPNFRNHVLEVADEVRDFRPEGTRSRAGERLEFWRKSIGFVVEAPVIGHGTGSIRDQFRRSSIGQTGMSALASHNPHNQILAVATQLGIVGTAVLFAMWLAHALLFRGGGLVAWAGLVIVTQNIVGSLFNSHLFDFTQGWGYVIGVGVAAGAVLRERVVRNSAGVS